MKTKGEKKREEGKRIRKKRGKKKKEGGEEKKRENKLVAHIYLFSYQIDTEGGLRLILTYNNKKCVTVLCSVSARIRYEYATE